MSDDGSLDPTAALAHAVAAAVVREVEDRAAIHAAAKAIQNGSNDRVASRFGYCLATAIVNEIEGG